MLQKANLRRIFARRLKRRRAAAFQKKSPTLTKRAWGTLKNHTLEYVPPEKTNPKGWATGATSLMPPLS